MAAVTADGPGGDVDAEQRSVARQLRINLLRHHAEREVLAYTMDCLILPDRLTTRGPGLGSRALEVYLVRAAARLTRYTGSELEPTPLTRALAEIGAAAKVVDATNQGRYADLWQNLAVVLDPQLFAKLFDVLGALPMGSPLETAQLRGLLQNEPCARCRVAVSYAHADDRLRQRFSNHLDQAVREGMIEAWDDRWIVAGTDWRSEIDERFREAEVVVLLVSDDFLNSRFCMDVELPLALARAARQEATVVPVIVRPCDWEKTVFKDWQVVRPHGQPVLHRGNHVEAWRFVIHEILRAAHETARHRPPDSVKPVVNAGKAR